MPFHCFEIQGLCSCLFSTFWSVGTVNAFLSPAPTLERKIARQVSVLSYYQDVFCLAFCARCCLVLSASLLHSDGQAGSMHCINKYKDLILSSSTWSSWKECNAQIWFCSGCISHCIPCKSEALQTTRKGSKVCCLCLKYLIYHFPWVLKSSCWVCHW